MPGDDWEDFAQRYYEEHGYYPDPTDYVPLAGEGSSLWDRVVSAAPSGVSQLLKNPTAWLAGVIVGWILDLWSGVLAYISAVFGELAKIPELAIVQPLVAIFRPLGDWVVSANESYQAMMVDMVLAAGPLGPLMWVVTWALPVILLVATFHFVAGFLSTYLPLESFPVLGRWFR